MVAVQLLSLWFAILGPVVAIWPEPSSISMGKTPLFINREIEVTYNGDQIPSHPGYVPPEINSKTIVHGGVSRALDTIFNHGLYPWMFHPRNETQSFQPNLSDRSFLKTLEITQTGKDNSSTFKPLAGEVDESYELSIKTDGKAAISAVSSIGVLRALETFTQLFYTYSNRHDYYTPYAPVSIKDAPKYTHRGLMLDTARDYYSVKSILRTIDGCSASKLNVLHWHVTDAQAWPLEIPAIPELSAKGAYHPDAVYTPADVRLVQEYGMARGVQVILEIDQPGHISSLAWSHPELLTAYEYQPYTAMCAEPPCGSLRLNDSAVDHFLDKVMDDLLPRVHPYSAYFHNGGDEIKASNSGIDPSVGTNNTAVVAKLLQTYTDKSTARVRKAGMTPMVWEEVPLDFNVTLGDDVVVQTWLGPDSVSKLTKRGLKVIDANYNYLYLDCGRGQWLTFSPGESYQSNKPFNDWCNPTKNWELIYSYNPTAGLTDEQAEKVIGSESVIWSELIDEVTLDGLAWPRASVMGEILWTGPLDKNGQSGSRTQTSAAPRINELRERLVLRGVQAARLQNTYCTEGGNCEQP